MQIMHYGVPHEVQIKGYGVNHTIDLRRILLIDITKMLLLLEKVVLLFHTFQAQLTAN